MIAVLRHHGFTVVAKPEEGVMSAALDLGSAVSEARRVQ